MRAAISETMFSLGLPSKKETVISAHRNSQIARKTRLAGPEDRTKFFMLSIIAFLRKERRVQKIKFRDVIHTSMQRFADAFNAIR